MEVPTIVPQPARFGQEHWLIDRAVASLTRIGAEASFWEALADHPALAQRVYDVYLASQLCASPSQAGQIMGMNMHGLGAARRHFNQQVDRGPFKVVRFSAETLEVCKNSYILVAITALSIRDLEAIAPQMGYRFDGVHPAKKWMVHDEEIAEAKPTPGWYLVRKDAVGAGKTHEKAQACLAPNEFVPNIAVVTQAALLHFWETGEYIFSQTHVWTSDIGGIRYTSSKGYPWSLICGERGLLLDDWGGEKHPTHGLASAIKPEVE